MKEEELKKERKFVKAQANVIKSKDEIRIKGLREFKSLGMCWNCTNLLAIITVFGKRMAKCTDLKVRLSPNDPVKSCTNYWPAYGLSLADMQNMAVLIEAGGRNKIGFKLGTDDEDWDDTGDL